GDDALVALFRRDALLEQVERRRRAFASRPSWQRALSALVRVDRAASVAERAFDLLAPAALSTVATKTTEHTIEDIVTMSGSMTFWAGELSIAVAVRACGLRHDRCSFPGFALSTWERSMAIETHILVPGRRGTGSRADLPEVAARGERAHMHA